MKAICGVVFCAGVLLGQQTWVVDAEGNGDFVFLADAVTAAAPGDTILVNHWSGLAANWNFTLSKGLTIVGVGFDRAEVLGHLVIADVPANQRVALRSLQVNALLGYTARVTVQNCAGEIVLDDVTLDGALGQLSAQPALVVAGSPRVHVGRCQLTGAPALGATGSVVTCTDSSIEGSRVVNGPGTAGLGVDAVGSRLSFAGGYLTGGSNYNLGGFAGPGKNALALAGSSATLADVVLYGGVGFNGLAVSVTADAASSLEADAATFFGTPIAGSGTVTSAETGALTGGTSPPGDGMLRLDAAPGAFGFVLLSLPGPEVATPWGPYWLGWVPVPFALGMVPVARALPPLPFLPHGFVLAAQGVVLHGGALRLSTPLLTTMP